MSQSRDKRLSELAYTIADHQARIEKLGSKWGAILTENLDKSELSLLDSVTDFMEKHKKGIQSVTAIADLERLERKIKKIRKNVFQQSFRSIYDEGLDLCRNEQKWAQRVTKEVIQNASSSEQKKIPTMELSGQKAIKESMSNTFIEGMKFEEWFSGTAEADLRRIVDMVRDGVKSGWTIQQMIQRIRGTKANGYTDGILNTTRKHASTMARTLCCGIANNAKDQFYRENDDVVIGVEWLDTLDARTCPRCGGMSRKRWKTHDPHPVPPLHHNCRCVLLPVTELTDLGEDMFRPAANADFDTLAKEAYESKYPGKKWENLAYDTRKKYYYQAQRDFENQTGKSAYSQVPGNMTYKEYFMQMDEKTRESYLGPGKYKLWKEGKLSIDKFIPPYPDRTFTVRELKEMDKESFK